MLLRGLCLFLTLPLLAAADSGTDLCEGETQLWGPGRLLGRWKVISYVVGGKTQKLPVHQMEVTKDQLRFSGGPMSGLVAKYVISTPNQPRNLDISPEGQPYLGIYQFEGNVLRMCWDDGHGKRPTELQSPKGTAWALMTLKRMR